MLEKIYTIPVNEAFDYCRDNEELGCPFCYLYRRLENDEIALILGASMMEPDTRIKTNALGFCNRHFDIMLERNNRLGLALILESHLAETREKCDTGGLFGSKTNDIPNKLQKLECSCYVCERIDYSFGKMTENAVYLWDTEREFREKTAAQPYFCLPHYRNFLQIGKQKLDKKRLPDFQKNLAEVVNGYFDKLKKDVSWFCKKFDYRYENEPWGDSKDAIERAIKFLTSDRRHKFDSPKK